MSEAAPLLFSIGHSNHPIELFLSLLRSHRIAAVADVRARPYSRFVPHFSKERLARRLQEEGIGYLYLGAELGGKPVRGEAPSAAPDYAARIAEPGFRGGIARLLEAARERPTAMLCRERDPLDCHRLHLIARCVRSRVADIRHILPDGSGEPQASTERRLLERAGGVALPLFDSDDALERAYDAWWASGR